MSKASKKPGKVQNQKSPKLDEKVDIEAQMALEEQRRQEELKRKEEEKLTEVLSLPTGLRLILNAYCIEHAWTHPKPKEFFTEYMTKYFKKEGLIENFESIEIAILSEFHLYNLIFAIEDLKLDKKKTCVFMNIMFQLIMNENMYYKEKIDLKTQKEADREKFFKNKTEAVDLKLYERLIMNHCVENPPSQQKYFELNEVRKIAEYVRKEYFMHYKLYKYVLCNKQKNEEIKISVYVDHPNEVRPLSEALFMGKIRHEVKQDDDEEMMREMEEKKRKEEEERLRMEELERLRKEEQANKLDDTTMEAIDTVLHKYESTVNRQLDDWNKNVDEKINALNPKAKKK